MASGFRCLARKFSTAVKNFTKKDSVPIEIEILGEAEVKRIYREVDIMMIKSLSTGILGGLVLSHFVFGWNPFKKVEISVPAMNYIKRSIKKTKQ